MKKQNYIYLTVGIVLFIVWCVDLLSFFKLPDIWYWIKGGYLLIGPLIFAGCFFEACSEENKETRKTCNICGEYIIKDEDSLHYIPKNGKYDTLDYCEKCKPKIAVE